VAKGIWSGSGGYEDGARRRVLAAVTAVGAVFVAAVVLAGVALALSGGAQRAAFDRSPGSRIPLVASRAKRAASVARVSRLVRVRWVRHQRWLESPGARAQRVVSRMAFHGLGVGAAEGLLMSDFGSVVRKVGVVPLVSWATSAPLVRYVSPYRAEVRGQRGLAYVNSVLPMARAVDGRERPVDLALQSSGAGFAPVNSPLLIARRLSGGVSLRSGGVGVVMEGRNVAGVAVGTSAVFFGGVAEDVDAAVAPVDGGVELFAVLQFAVESAGVALSFCVAVGCCVASCGSWWCC
jgi:hypothetical protein